MASRALTRHLRVTPGLSSAVGLTVRQTTPAPSSCAKARAWHRTPLLRQQIPNLTGAALSVRLQIPDPVGRFDQRRLLRTLSPPEGREQLRAPSQPSRKKAPLSGWSFMDHYPVKMPYRASAHEGIPWASPRDQLHLMRGGVALLVDESVPPDYWTHPFVLVPNIVRKLIPGQPDCFRVPIGRSERLSKKEYYNLLANARAALAEDKPYSVKYKIVLDREGCPTAELLGAEEGAEQTNSAPART